MARATTRWMLYTGLSAAALVGCGEDTPRAAAPLGEVAHGSESAEPVPPDSRDDERAEEQTAKSRDEGAATDDPVVPSATHRVEPHVLALLDGLIDVEGLNEVLYHQPPERLELWLVGAGPCKDCAFAALLAEERADRMKRIDHDLIDDMYLRGPEQEHAVLDFATVCDGRGGCAVVLQTETPVGATGPTRAGGPRSADWSLTFIDASGGSLRSHSWSLPRVRSPLDGRHDVSSAPVADVPSSDVTAPPRGGAETQVPGAFATSTDERSLDEVIR